MASAIGSTVRISLHSWIIQDGNYLDFRQGEVRSFAIAFDADAPVETKSGKPGLIEHIEEFVYRAVGRVVHRTADLWVMDFGFGAYADQDLPDNAITGRLLEGNFGLGIDPYDYYDTLHSQSGVPPLIYDWRIKQILMNMAPFIETNLHGTCYRERDPDRRARREVSATDANVDDGGDADYILVCERLDKPPRSVL